MKIFKNKSPFWTVLVLVGLLYLTIQLFYVEHDFPKSFNASEFPEKQTVFFTVKEQNLTVKTSGFETLVDRVKLWEYDKIKDQIKNLWSCKVA